MSIEESVERVKVALLARMAGRAFILPKGLVEGLARETEKSALTVRQCLGRLAKVGWLDGVADDGTPLRRITIATPAPAAPPSAAQVRWQTVLSRCVGLTDGDRSALRPLWHKLDEFDERELEQLVTGLLNLRNHFERASGRNRFLVSAQHLLGSAKLLDALASPSLRDFGLPISAFPTHPRYVVVAGAKSPTSVVLVENPAAFECAAYTRAAESCAFVATFGFGLGRDKDDFGNQLVDMVADRFSHTVTLRRDGSHCPAASELLAHPKITFWGDLDLAGLHIYLQLKQSIPNLSLSALYEPMIAALASSDRCHRYLRATGKAGQQGASARPSFNDAMVQRLAALCANRGVDQELITVPDIERLAGLAFRLS